MAMQRFLCFDLRTGILAMAVFHLISAVFAALVHFILSLDDSDPEAAADQTFMLGGDIIGILILACLAYGAHKEARGFLLPFLVVFALPLALITLMLPVLLFYGVFLLPILLLVILSIYCYIWYAVLSLYQMMDPHNPNYVPQQMPATIVYVEDAKPPSYYENTGADDV